MLTEQQARTKADAGEEMDFGFLVHLADMGAADPHPLDRRAMAALIDQLDLQAGQSVLEVGCETGAIIARLARYNLARINGLDLLPAMLRVARQRIRLAGLGARSRLYLASKGHHFLPAIGVMTASTPSLCLAYRTPWGHRRSSVRFSAYYGQAGATSPTKLSGGKVFPLKQSHASTPPASEISGYGGPPAPPGPYLTGSG